MTTARATGTIRAAISKTDQLLDRGGKNAESEVVALFIDTGFSEEACVYIDPNEAAAFPVGRTVEITVSTRNDA